MSGKIKVKILIPVLILILMFSSFMVGIGLHSVVAKNETSPDFDLIFDVYHLLKRESIFVENNSNSTEMIYGAVRGMLASLGDDYTRFMDPKAYDDMQVEIKGSFGGIGIQIGIKDGKLKVMVPLPDTPASRKGLQSGDWIIKVDGKSTKNMSIEEAVSLIRGEVGTKVHLTITRKNVKEPLEFDLIREVIKVKSLEYKFASPEIGYIKIFVFSETTGRELKEAIEKLKEKGMKSLILDLRFNPGGALSAAIDVSSLFVENGKPVVKVVGRRDGEKVYDANSNIKYHYPLVVLVNGYSASAAEIVTGALMDYKLATIIGSKFKDDEIMKTGKTFGKGSVQTVHPLHDGSAVAITTAKYYTALGQDINKKGITPDIIIEITKDDLTGKSKQDPQLKEAKRVLMQLLTKKATG